MLVEFMKEAYGSIIRDPLYLIKAMVPGLVVGLAALLSLGLGFVIPQAGLFLLFISVALGLLSVLLFGVGTTVSAAYYGGVAKKAPLEMIKFFFFKQIGAGLLYILPISVVVLLLGGTTFLSAFGDQTQNVNYEAMILSSFASICFLLLILLSYSLAFASYIYRVYTHPNKSVLELYKEQWGLALKKPNLKFGVISFFLAILIGLLSSVINQVFLYPISILAGGLAAPPLLAAGFVVLVLLAVYLINLYLSVFTSAVLFKYARAYKL